MEVKQYPVKVRCDNLCEHLCTLLTCCIDSVQSFGDVWAGLFLSTVCTQRTWSKGLSEDID